MNILDNKTRNLVFYVFLVIAIVYMLVANQIGGDQDSKNLVDYQQYQTATNLANQQKFAEAQPILSDLVSRYSKSYVINWQYAICLDGLGNSNEADKYYAIAEKLRPFIVKNQYYLVQRGKVLYQLGKYDEAKKYLLYSKKINESNDLTTLSDQLLNEITKKSLNTNK